MSFRGGGLFLPARSPYDRQLLVEHVLSRVRAAGQVQVLLDDQRWMVHRHRGQSATCCARCGAWVDSACYAGARLGQPYCVRCALGVPRPVLPPEPIAERRVVS